MAGLSLPVLPTPLLVVVIILGLVYARSRLAWRKRCLGRPLPPGPAKLPLLGNVFNVPTSKPWTAYRDMGLKYGTYSSTAMDVTMSTDGIIPRSYNALERARPVYLSAKRCRYDYRVP